MDEYNWTTGNEGDVKHNRVIEAHANGGVHELLNRKSGEVLFMSLDADRH